MSTEVDAGRPLPLPSGGLSRRRRILSLAWAAVSLPALTAVLVAIRGDLSYATPVLLVLSDVVVVALIGGLWPALPTALVGGLALNWYFTPPLHSLTIGRADHAIVLAVYAAVAAAVSIVVDQAARRTAEAARSRAEAHMLSSLAGAELAGKETLPSILERVRAVFGMREAALLENVGGYWSPVARAGSGEPGADESELRVDAGPRLALVVRGPALFAEDRRVLTAFAEAAGTALEGRRLAETDRMRTALLAAVGHDLRTPLSSIKAAVSGLRQGDVAWTPEESAELLATIEEGADRLEGLVANLLDASRLQAGAVSLELTGVVVTEAVARAVKGLAGRERVTVDVGDGVPLVHADLGLLERVLANLIDNALRHAGGRPVRVHADDIGGEVVLAVVDHGPGVPAAARERMFAPFQRLSDRAPGGVGLGLAVAKGFTESMGGRLVASETPGGGLTMSVELPVLA